MEHQGHSFSLGTANETIMTADVDSSKTPQLTLLHGKNRTSIALVCCNICTRTTMLVDSMEADSGEYVSGEGLQEHVRSMHLLVYRR